MKAEERTYETALGTVHYWVSRAQAQRRWLVFLPGLTADHRLFDRQMEALGQRYGCLTWDAPAHGLSRPFELTFSMDDMARMLHGILEAEGIERPVLIGQSLGGYISQVYMELYPGEAAGFVSIDSCSLKRKYYTGWELALLKHTKGMYMSIPWRLLTWWGALGTAQSPYGRALMREMLQSYEKTEYCTLAGHGFRNFAQAVEAPRRYELSCPVLLLCGEKDGAGSAKRYNRAWAEQDGCRIVWLEGAGHNSNTDVPERVNQLIDAFASSLDEQTPDGLPVQAG